MKHLLVVLSLVIFAFVVAFVSFQTIYPHRVQSQITDTSVSYIMNSGSAVCQSEIEAGQAVVFQTDGRGLNLRKNPSIASRIIVAIPEGSSVTLGSLDCQDPELYWWEATWTYRGSQYSGWLAEGEAGYQYLANIQ
jgi:hypothetical protein